MLPSISSSCAAIPLVEHPSRAWKGEYNTNVSGPFPMQVNAKHEATFLDMRLSHALVRQRRTPCFPQIDLTLRAILHEKQPRFLVLFSHQTTSYSQIFFTHPSFVPDEDIFYDYPIGCPNPCCTDDCEMIRFPRRGLESASMLKIKRKGRYRRITTKQMCNWIDCDVCFNEEVSANTSGSSEGSEISFDLATDGRVAGQTCSKCKLVKYCSPEHQRKDWDEHRRVCTKPLA